MRRLIVLVVGVVLAASACSTSAEPRIVLAAGTTAVDSGLIELLVQAYANDGGEGQIDVVGLSSQQSIAYAIAGNADVMITHDPEALGVYLDNTPHTQSSPAFTSRFLYVAPPGMNFPEGSIEGVLTTVASDGLVFVSRDDGSGTHTKELSLWNSVGIEPTEQTWYVRTGTGMGETLLVTDQKAAVTLAEIGSYLSASDQISLVPVDAGSDPSLDNPYAVTVVSPAENPAAAAFGAWLTSESGRAAIVDANETLFGSQVYRVP